MTANVIHDDFARPSEEHIQREIIMKIRFHGKKLTERQVDVLKLIGEGYSNTEISNELCLSPRTVETHVYKIKHLISRDQSSRLGDRRLVLLAKEMLEGYQEYLKLKTNPLHALRS